MNNRIYVAATSQHVGKTTSTLGLTSALIRLGFDTGYCKPVGQQFVDLGDLCVDKDALLFSEVLKFPLSAELHSPVILGPGATSTYLDNPEKFPYADRIAQASRALHELHELVVYEGTGHPGVGSVVGLSNAEVARMLGASVIMIVEGGIGSTIDELNRSLSLFREHQVPIIGIIVNKVIPEKIEKVTRYVGQYLEQNGLHLLGVMPYDKSLSNPIMETVKTAVRGRVVAYPEKMDNRVEHIVPGSLVDDQQELDESRNNMLLVVSHNRFERSVERIIQHDERMGRDTSPLSGIIITGDGRHEQNFKQSPHCNEYIDRYEIPVITTPLDTLGSMIKINRIEVKINHRTPWKTQLAIELIQAHVDLPAIAAAVRAG